jgi:hypothetical protein
MKRIVILVAFIALVVLGIFNSKERAKGDLERERAAAVAKVEAERGSRARLEGTRLGRERFDLALRSGESGEMEESVGQRLARLLNGEEMGGAHRVTREEVEAYLLKHKESPFSLVAAFGATGNIELLKRAATNAPNDPLVQMRVLVHNAFPEERDKWIEALKKSSPDNSLPHFLKAKDLMASGDGAGALEEIRAAGGKKFDDFTKEMAFAQEEVYLSAGRNVAEAKALGSAEVLLPHLAPFKQLGNQLAELAGEYGKADDRESEKTLLRGTWELGQQLVNSGRDGVLITGLVGLAIENKALRSWPEDEPSPFPDKSVADQLARNASIREEVRNVNSLFEQWLPAASENEIISYFDHMRLFGEWESVKWLKRQYPELGQPK